MGTEDINISQEKKTVKNITPTVVVGLGGTGWEVLTRIKERLGYYIGGLPYYACLNFLHIDTDKPRLGGWQDDVQTKHIHASHGSEGLFDDVDTYGIGTWLPARGTETVRSFDTGAGQVRPYGRLAFFANYISGGIKDAIKDAFDHIKDKQSREKLKESPKYKQLEEKTQICMDTDGNNDVIIVASIAGGTGSGMFFDAVTALRQHMNGKGMVYAYLLFPDHYRDVGNIESMRANGYAFLKELEYFQLNNTTHTLEARWPGDRTPDVKIIPPLCNRVYLYSHTDEMGRVTSKEDIYDCIAESIFKDFTFGGFADEKRSSENNENRDLVTMYSQNEVKDNWGNRLRRSSSRHFQALGYASLGMPHDQLIEACAYKLAAQVAQSWHPAHTEGQADSRTVDDALQAAGLRISLGNISSNTPGGKDGVDAKEMRSWCLLLKKRQFSKRADEVDMNWLLLHLLETRHSAQKSELCWLDDEHARLGTAVEVTGSKSAAIQIDSAVKDCEAAMQVRWDAHIGRVSASLLREVKDRLEAWCRERVTYRESAATGGEGENKPVRLGFIDVVKVLTELKDRLTQLAARLDGPVASGLQSSYDDQKKRFTHFLGKLREYPEDGRFGMFRRLEKAVGIINPQANRQLLANQACICSFGDDGDIGYLEYALYKKLAAAAADIMRQMVGFVDNLSADYSLDPERLSNAVRYLNDRCDAAFHVRSSQHVKSLFDGNNAKDFEDIYAASLRQYHSRHSQYVSDSSASPEANERRFCQDDIKLLSSRFAEEIGDMGRVRLALQRGFGDALTLNADNADWVHTLISLTQVPFREELPNVCCFWSRFAEAYTSEKQKEDAVIELFEASAYWLNRNHAFDYNTLRHGGTERATYVLAGLPMIPDALEGQERQRMQELRDMVKGKIEALADDLKLTFKDLPTSDELIVYRRSIALPLCYSDELVTMQEAYAEVRASGKPLHITKRKRIFADISLLTSQAASVATQAVRDAILGLAFNIVKTTPRPLNPGDTVRVYDYTYVKPALGADVNFLGQCCKGDGAREVAEHFEMRGKDDIVTTIERQIERKLESILHAEDGGKTLKHWAVWCEKMMSDLPREIDESNTNAVQSDREIERAVYFSLQRQALELLRQTEDWKDELDCAAGEQSSDMQLQELALQQGDSLFPPRKEDNFRVWNTDWA